MLDVNDDMDELFRRAAENYPLKTDSNDWDKVAANLPATPPEAAGKSWFHNGRSLLLLLLVLPAAFICNHYTNSTSKADVNKLAYKDATHAANQINITGNTNTQHLSTDNKNRSAVQQQAPKPSNTSLLINADDDATRKVLSNTRNNYHTSNNTTNNSRSTPAEILVKATNDETKNLVEPITPSESKNKGATQTLPITKEQTNIKEQANIEATPTESKQQAAQQKQQQVKQAKALHLYAGIVANIDVSSVKFQSLRSPGTGAGILLGYKLNKRLSIESGLYMQKKFYYTDAKYYNPKTPYTAPSFKLLNVDGNCSMLEVPLNIKYDFTTTAKNKWFAVAGMSSYFMKKENYDYTSESWGQVSTKNVSYSNASNAILSVMNISAGYQRQLGKSASLRIEPYLKLPVKGYGWGRLPIISSGLNVGYITKIF